MSEADRLSAFANVPHELAEIVVIHAIYSGLLLREMRGDCRLRYMVNARTRAANMARSAGYSYPQIGRALNRDHTTIMNLVRRAV